MKKAIAKSFSKTAVVKDILLEAKVLGIASGSAKVFAEKVAEKSPSGLSAERA